MWDENYANEVHQKVEKALSKPDSENADSELEMQMKEFAYTFTGRHPNASQRQVTRAIKKKFPLSK